MFQNDQQKVQELFIASFRKYYNYMDFLVQFAISIVNASTSTSKLVLIIPLYSL